MTLSNGVRESSYGRQTETVVVPVLLGPLQRCRAGLSSLGLVSVFVAVSLAGCGMSDGVGALAVDPGRYDAYHCKDLATRWKDLLKRESDLRGLMDKANESGGGVVIGTMAYRTDYETVLVEEKLLQRTAAEKKCDLSASAYQSDQTIR
jgi:hypothetical protein